MPFGEARIITRTVMNNFRLPGQYYDAETGLHYNWHRYYDPATGRYLTPDSAGLAGGTNLYPYALNNPANFIDPDGGNPLAAVLIITGYYLLTNPDVANAPDRCDDLYGSYGAEKIVGEGIVDILVIGILSKLIKAAPKGETYEIIDGVRRTKANELLGNKTIKVNIRDRQGRLVKQTEVSIDSLRSPHKSAIDMSTQASTDRYMRVQKGIQAGENLPPIDVTLGQKGVKIEDIIFDVMGEL